MSKRAFVAGALLIAAAIAQAEETPLKDPMRPFVAAAPGAAAEAAGPRFALTAVLIAPTRRVAVVNGKPYVLGEAVDGAEIVAIAPESVRLREGSVELVISLGRPGNGQASRVEGETVP